MLGKEESWGHTCSQSGHITQQSLPQHQGAGGDTPAEVMGLRAQPRGDTLVLGTEVGKQGWVGAGSCGKAFHVLALCIPRTRMPLPAADSLDYY